MSVSDHEFGRIIKWIGIIDENDNKTDDNDDADDNNNVDDNNKDREKDRNSDDNS